MRREHTRWDLRLVYCELCACTCSTLFFSSMYSPFSTLQFFWIAVSFVFLLKIEIQDYLLERCGTRLFKPKNSSGGMILDDLCTKSLYKNIFDVSRIPICICNPCAFFVLHIWSFDVNFQYNLLPSLFLGREGRFIFWLSFCEH